MKQAKEDFYKIGIYKDLLMSKEIKFGNQCGVLVINTFTV